jgi:AmmeMemoRadiSam system protein B
MIGNIRKAYVAGKFYPAKADEIDNLICQIAEKEKLKINYSLSERNIVGAILPHAGHIYSGYQTVHFFEILKRSEQVFDTWVIIHPLHQGRNLDFAVEGNDFWQTPFGNVKVDQDFIQLMKIPVSNEIHRYEHSSEVILPFIQNYFGNDFSFVSIGMAKQNPETVAEISNNLQNAIEKSKKKVCLIASSDFSHYVEPEVGKKLDQKVLDCILKKDTEGIYREVSENNLSVCGYGPIMVLCKTLKNLYPAVVPEVMARGHSGEVSRSLSVVDYLSILFYT